MKKALEIFEEICKIPHGSGDLDALHAWLMDYAKRLGCEVKTDAVKNIYMKKGKPRVCFQAHYDMVTVGEAAKGLAVRTYIDDKNILRAHDSSLGADNGIAVAAILALFEKHSDFEALITSDEETGMYGAQALDIPVESKTMINLDSEEFGEIVISCAGGFDVVAKLALKSAKASKANAFSIETKGFIGGHSGIQIGQNISNAIVELAGFCIDHACEIADIKGGEKRNSIPVHAKAVVLCDEDLTKISNPHFEIKKLEQKPNTIYPELASILFAYHSGVLAIDDKSKDILNSRNLAIVELNDGILQIQIMARANKNELLQYNLKNTLAYFKNLDCIKKDIKIEGTYAPWENDALALENSKLLNLLKSCFKNPKIVNIHAGLECGILQTRLAKLGVHDMEIFSIGPNISHPHSLDECLDLNSFEKLYDILDELLTTLEK